MAQQVNRSLQFFFGASHHSSVDQLIIAGGSAGIDGAGDVIADATETETVVANPFSQMSVSSRIKPQQLAGDAPALMTACGLALRSFD
jgi:type IV pilus assembly protein PilM